MKLYAILTLALALSTSVFAQNNSKTDREARIAEFRQKHEQYIREKASLTEAEASAVLPILAKMHKQTGALFEEAKRLKGSVTTETSETAARKIVEQITDLKEKEAEIIEDAYEKMCDKISAHKVIDIMRAEDDFHRQMLQGRHNGRGPGNGNGRQPGKQK